MSLAYATATSGALALADLERVLQRYGCQAFGTLHDAEKGTTMVHFRWRGRTVQIEASWRGYAAALLRDQPWSNRRRGTRQEYEQRAAEQARISVCSVLRDWIKAQVTAIEAGILTFDVAFMPHMMLGDGQRLADWIVEKKLLPAPEPANGR